VIRTLGSPENASTARTGADGRILVVEDNPLNRKLLVDLLDSRGFGVESVEDGPSALQRIRESPPDVVLLDVMMPGMTGFEVCRRIREDLELAHLPVLMVTALSDRADRLAGIDAGADDFLQKPVDRHEVLLRVRNALHRSRLFQELETQHEKLREMEALRDSLTRMLVHDLRSPLTAILTNLQLLEMSAAERLDEEEREDLRQALAGGRSLADMVSQILVVSQGQETDLEIQAEEVELQRLMQEALDPLRPLAREHRLTVEVPDEPLVLVCDPGLIRRTVSNLFGNAVKFVPAGEMIRVGAGARNGCARIEVEDTGPGVPPESREMIFKQFVRGTDAGDTASESSGLGLTFCKMAVEAHGGRIGVESEPGQGSLFWVEIPREPE
jgi:two-component system, sensor histidine kinase and response regulator